MTSYIGVSRSYNRYRARISLGGWDYHLGTHDTPEQAARAYDRALIDSGQLSKRVGRGLNFPEVMK